MYTQRTRIQKRIIELLKAGEFYAVTYNKTTRLPDEITREEGNRVVPATTLSNETGSQFSVDNKMGRRLVSKRTSWTFEALLSFHQEVTIEFFEESLLDPPVLLAADTDHEQVTLFLTRASVQHPTTQNAATGTQARLVFEAILGRV